MSFSPQSRPPVPRSGILDIAPYVGGKSDINGVKHAIKLSSNETPLGASPEAIAAAQVSLRHTELYPDGSAAALRDAIASAYGIDANRIVCGAGSDNLLELLIRAYVGPDDEVLFTEHGFLMYKIFTLSVGGTPVAVSEHNHTAHVDSLLAAVTCRTKMVFIANPNNPTGTYIAHSEIKRLRVGLPKNVVLVLDNAYAEYMETKDYGDGFDLVDNIAENTVVTRTFSKIYGLAALRLGWAYCPLRITDILNRLRSPFNVTTTALAAGVEAIKDQAYMIKVRDHNAKWRAFMEAELATLGLAGPKSYGNFVLMKFRSSEEARAADQFLQSRGYVIRDVMAYGLPEYLRMTIGLEHHCRGVISVMRDFLTESRP